MKFAKAGGKIKCIRTDTEAADARKDWVVAEFDDVIDKLAPHVVASLHDYEIDQLYSWLRDHTTLKAKLAEEPLEKTILETIPAMLNKATAALEQLDTLDVELYQSIKLKSKAFNIKLEEFKPLIKEDSPELNEIEEGEILKTQLVKLKEGL